MKTTIKTQIRKMAVELTNDTMNGTRYLLCIGNRRIYTSEDLTLSNEDLIWLTEKCELNSAMVLPKLIMMYKDAEAEAQAPVEGITDALGVTYRNTPIPAGFDAEDEVEDEVETVKATVNPLTRKLIECSHDFNNVVFEVNGAIVKVPTHKLSVNPSNLKATVKATVKRVSKVRKESLYDLSGRVHNIAGKLVKAPLMPSLDKDYDVSYYGRFEVHSRFRNWNGTPQLGF